MEIGSTQKGKLGEYYVFWELIKRDFELYIPVIDIEIDAVMRLEDGTYVLISR